MKRIVDIGFWPCQFEGDPTVVFKADDGTYYEPVIDYQSRRLLKPKAPTGQIMSELRLPPDRITPTKTNIFKRIFGG